MAKSVVAFSLAEFDPSYTRVLIGNADFGNSKITDLGTLEVITGIAYFNDSKVENLGNLTTIGRDAIFRNSQVEDLGNLTTINGSADFYGNEKLKNLGNLTTIRGYANFIKSQVKNLGNLTIIYGDADFRNSQVKDLGNLTTIYGDALFVNSQVKDLGKLKTIKGFVSFDNQELADQWKKRSNKDNFKTGGQSLSKTPAPKKIDEKVGKEFWFEYHCFESPTSCDSEIWYRSHQKVKVLKVVHWSYDDKSERLEDGNPRVYLVEWEDGFQYDVFEDELMQSPNEFYRPDTPKRMKKGGRTIAQTPAPKKERIYGSEKNKPESSKDTKSAEKIEFNEKTLETIKNKVAEHNEKNPKKKVTLASAKAVVRRGMGAYSSTHRPTISGGKPNSRVAWGLARLNAFFYKIINGKSKSGKYSQDNDLINELGYKVAKYNDGGLIAPNGKPSNLTPEQYKLVRTKAFKDWFGDWEKDPANASKVVDENGEPLVVYHGTNTQFNVFDKNFIGSSNDSGFYGKGFYFNHNSIDVKKYGNIIKTYFLKIKNPVITYDSPKEFSTSIWIPKGAKNLLGQGLEPYEWHKWNFYLDDNFSKKVTDYILEMGRDGIIAENVGEYVIYEPNQIKLADGTNTTFDGNNPDIRYADGGITITDEFSTESYDFGNVGNSIKKNNVEVGQIQYDINKEKGIVSIYLLEVLEKGIGAKVINYFFNNGINIIYGDAVDSIEFWQKMGAKFEEFNEDINGYPFTISKEDFFKTKYYENTNPDIRFMAGGVPKKLKFDIEENEGVERTEISINGVGKVILVMTYPEYEFMDDIGEDGLEELGIEEGEIIGKIEHIKIEDDFKGKGYAKLLMKKAIEIAEEKGLMPLYLNASPMGNKGLNINDLTAFYESFGFEIFLEQGNNNLMILK